MASQTLRQAIRGCGETLYRVAKDSGVPYATLHRFMANERGVSTATFDALCAYLRLNLTPQTKKREE
jgi:hypothetical protein